MPQAATNRVTLRTVKEVTPGVTPATPIFRHVRFTSGSPRANPTFVESQEIIADRMTADIIMVGRELGGDVASEVSKSNLPEEMYESAMMSPRSITPYREGAAEITAVSATAYTVTNPGSGAQGVFAEGLLVKATGFAQAGNNRVFRAAATSSATSVVMTGGTVEVPSGQQPRLKVIGVEGASGDITATASGLGSTALNFLTIGCFYVGQWVWVGGLAAANKFAAAGAYGLCRISAITATALTFDAKPTTWTTDTGTGKTIRVYAGDFLKNGTTLQTYTVERDIGDIARYDYYSGYATNMLGFQLASQQIAQMTVGLTGLGYTPLSGARFAGAATRENINLPICNTSSHVASLRDAGVEITGPNFVLGLNVGVNNNLRNLPRIGSLDFVGLALGEGTIEGQLTAYLGDETLLARVFAGTTLGLDFALLGDDGTGVRSGLVVDLPKIKYSGGVADVGAKNTEINQVIPFRALKAQPVAGGASYAMSLTLLEGVGS